jgi:AraC-like DNA-binding protein
MYVFYRVKAKRDLQFYISKNTPKVINRIVFLFAINLIPSIFLVLFAILNSTLKSNNWLIVFSEFSYVHKSWLYFVGLILPVSVLSSPGIIFYREHNQENEVDLANKASVSIKSEQLKYNLNSIKSEDLIRILEYLDQKKPYLNAKFSIHEITRELNIPHARVTFCFNKQLGTPFPLYKNKLRVSHAESMMRDGAHLTMTIEGIGVKSGFKSISVFYAAFREVHGMTPAEWIKENL